MAGIGYEHLPGFANVYLEDSFVLDVRAKETRLEFLLDLVLREGHERYHLPARDEQYCYELATLVFPDVSMIEWIQPLRLHRSDAESKTDFGNIDSFQVLSPGEYFLEGEWGTVRLRCGVPFLVPAEERVS